MTASASKKRFRRINLVTIFLLFTVILAGGVVRSTGSGMGCPDWPKCFGMYVPPVSVTELPKGYKKNYVEKRVAKNERFAKMLDFFGYNDLAQRIRADKSILVPEEFNSAKTWTEYINRLIGAISGLFLLLTAVFSFSYRKELPWLPLLCIGNVILVAIQAWLGAIVVSTNLVAWIVTVHMLLALAIVALSIYTYHLAKVYGKTRLKVRPVIVALTIVALLLTTAQVVFGSQVREKIDAVASHFQGGYRNDWINHAGAIFSAHRNVAIVVMLVNLGLLLLIRNAFNKDSVQQQLMSLILLVVMLQIVAGIVLSYWSLPPVAQVSHLVLASFMFGAQFYLLLNLYRAVSVRGINK